jgi:cytochrome c oxidase cbb3-type subunit III
MANPFENGVTQRRTFWPVRKLVRVVLYSFLVSSAAAQKPVDQANPPRSPNPAANPQNPMPMSSFLALPPDPLPEVVQRGKRLYTASCAFCHGASATGGESGPNLVRSVVVLHDKGTGTVIGPILLAGRTEKGMPKFSVTPDQIIDLAGFLLSLQNAAADRSRYRVEFALSGDAARGKQFFASHCVDCHGAVDTFKVLVQTKEPAQVQDLFVMPKGAKKQAIVTTSSGESFAGELVQLDDFVVTIRDKSGRARSWTLEGPRQVKVEVIDPLLGHRDLLPKYSDHDIHDILAYLETLK